MSGYRGGRGGRGRGGRGGGGARPSGAFLNGQWHCDCNPPQPAVHFLTKKEGPNKGRWFRTCQKAKEDGNRCGFFLWDTEAAPREALALANSSRTEPGREHLLTPSQPKLQRAVSPPPAYTPVAGPSELSRKRSRTNIQEDDDEFGLGGNPDFDEELDQVMTAVETPSKKARTDAFTTPARRRLPWQKDSDAKAAGIPTPQTEQQTNSTLFPTRYAAPGGSFLTPSKYKDSDHAEPQTLTPVSSPVDTPTPNRFKDATVNTDNELAQDVFGVLQEANVNLTEPTRRNLTAVLSKHATIAEGVKKGRDVARTSIKAKDAKVTELTYRVSTLEAELEEQKAMVMHLQWQTEHGHSED